jgi:hypothetical protein
MNNHNVPSDDERRAPPAALDRRVGYGTNLVRAEFTLRSVREGAR